MRGTRSVDAGSSTTHLVPRTTLRRGTVCGLILFSLLAGGLFGGGLPAAQAQIGKPKGEPPVLEASAFFTTQADGAAGRLVVTAKLAEGWYIYSLTTPPGGPTPSALRIDESSMFTLSGAFQPTVPPKQKQVEAFQDVPFVEYHDQTVTWSAPITFAAGSDPRTVKVTGGLRYQACDKDSCRFPTTAKFTALLKPAVERTPQSSETRAVEAPAIAGGILGGALGGGKLNGVPALPPSMLPPSVEPPMSTPVAALPTDPAAVLASLQGSDVGKYQGKGPTANTTLYGYVEPTTVSPGGEVRLVLAAVPNVEEHYHLYERRDVNNPEGSKPTLIVPTALGDLRLSNPPEASAASEAPGQADLAAGALPYYSGPVQWVLRLTVPADATPGPRMVEGLLAYQSCTSVDDEGRCDMPAAVRFSAVVNVGPAPSAAPTSLVRTPVTFQRDAYSRAASLLDAKLAAGTPLWSTPVVAASTTEPSPESPVASVATNDPGAGNSGGNTGGGNTGGGSLGGVESAAPAGTSAPVAATSGFSPVVVLGQLALAFLGGFILNFMPCVLPVVGLKIMGFVQQAGESRARVWMLNGVYALGMLVVFWSLAVVSMTAGLIWGAQFSNVGFNVAVTSVVFVFALSFLGVWEIPIPGFVGSSAQVNQMASREGLSGAFFKGMLTTVLATPCSGPGLGPVIAWAGQQPAWLNISTFTMLGLGMASPYLVIGAFPRLVAFLPKPGAWMDTFKQVMGFVLMGTVVYLLTLVPLTYVVPLVCLLTALGAGCWWVGRTPIYSETPELLRAWGSAAVFAGVFGWFAFSWLAPVMQGRFDSLVEKELVVRQEAAFALGESTGVGENPLWKSFVKEREEKLAALPPHELPWQHYTPFRLKMLQERGYTVLIDFTANWCATCQVNLASVLDQPDTRKQVDELNVVTLIVDFSVDNPEGQTLLDALGGKSIPYLAVYPGSGGKPTILPDLLTKSGLSQALTSAGPSRPRSTVAVASNP